MQTNCKKTIDLPQKTVKIKSGFDGLTCFVVFSALIYSFDMEVIKGAGRVLLLLCFFVLGLKIAICYNSCKLSKLYICFALYTLLCLCRALINFTGFKLVVQIATIFLLIIYAEQVDNQVILQSFFYCLIPAIILCYIDILISWTTQKFVIYGNPNKNGMLSFIFICVSLGKHWNNSRGKFLSCLIGIILIIICKSRTPLLALIVGGLFGLIVKGKSARTSYILFVILTLAFFIFVYFYAYGDDWTIMQSINDLVIKLTGKRLFSGRNRMWRNIFDNFDSSKLIFGYGISYDVSGLSGIELTAHNQFIQIFVQQGLVGLLLLYTMLTYFFTEAVKRKNILGASFIVMIIVYNMFEVCLLQSFGIAVLFWLIIAANRSKIKK